MQLNYGSFRLFFLLCLIWSFTGSCRSSRSIIYKSDSESVQKSIQSALSKISKNVALDIRQKNIFILLDQGGGVITMTFINASNLPPDYKEVVKKSNRFFQVSDNQKIPIIFPWDCLTNAGKGYAWHMGGYAIRINYQHEIIDEGYAW